MRASQYTEQRGRRRSWLVTLLLLFCSSVQADDLFERRVRPLLIKKCGKCHRGRLAKAGLDLTSAKGIQRGGKSGQLLVPGKPGQSRLIQAVRYRGRLKMPPQQKLNQRELAVLEQWVKSGGQLPKSAAAGVRESGDFTSEDRQWWAFQPPRPGPLPQLRDVTQVRNSIDRFILARLHQRGLRQNPAADRLTMIRRLTFDLVGLPPTPDEIRHFLADASPLAYANVVDRLLASPQYGIRWGRHWLDMARYSDTNGGGFDYVYPNAWRYRDYVVESCNSDKPFDQFVIEQLAGDRLPGNSPDRAAQLVATGFLMLAPKGLGMQDKELMVMDVVDDQIDVIGRSLMGLTLSCARCHDHKFDPIPTADYYSLAGIFRSTVLVKDTNKNPSYWPEASVESAQSAKARRAYLKRLSSAKKSLAALQAKLKQTKAGKGKEKLAVAVQTAQQRLKQLQAKAPSPVPMAMVARDNKKVRDVRVHIAGERTNLGELARRGFPEILAGQKRFVGATGSGRLQLARWLVNGRHPLTARVFVNRTWQHFFGQGLVRTPDNFGRLGEKPSHPRLLDWLAVRFVADKWSVKQLHRRIVMSATYRQSSKIRGKALAIDSGNRLLWRMNRRRLSAEAIRDATLVASGQIDFQLRGTINKWKHRMFSVDDANNETANFVTNRRAIYLPVVRGAAVHESLQLFDFGDPNSITPQRDNTTVPPQALYMLNNPVILARATAFAVRLEKAAQDAPNRIRLAYLRAVGRNPTTRELQRARAFVDGAGKKAWTWFCQSLFCLNEFVYLD